MIQPTIRESSRDTLFFEREHTAIRELLKAYGVADSLEGELVFAAVEPGAHLNVMTPLLRGNGYNQLRQSGLNDALMLKLDGFIKRRVRWGVPCARNGVLRFAKGMVSLEWLPDSAASQVALARQCPEALLAGLVAPLRNTHFGVLEDAAINLETPYQQPSYKKATFVAPHQVVAEQGRRLGFCVQEETHESLQDQALSHNVMWKNRNACQEVVSKPLAMVSVPSAAPLQSALKRLFTESADSFLVAVLIENNEAPDLYLNQLIACIQALSTPLPQPCLLCVWQETPFRIYTQHCPKAVFTQTASAYQKPSPMAMV